MRIRMLRLIGALVGLAVAAMFSWAAASFGGAQSLGFGQPAVHRVPNVVVRDAGGHRVRLQVASGPRLVVLGYVGCGTTCPRTLAAVSQALQASPHRASVRALFVDIDPRIDTTPVVRKFVQHFSGVEGIVPDVADVPTIERALGAAGDRRRDGLIDHDARIFVVDARGVVVDTLLPEVTQEQLARVIAAQR